MRTILAVIVVSLLLGYAVGYIGPRPPREHMTSDPNEAFRLVNEEGWTVDRIAPETENDRRIYTLKH